MWFVHDVHVLILSIVELDARSRCGSLVIQYESVVLKQGQHLLESEVSGKRLESFDQFLFLIHRCKGN